MEKVTAFDAFFHFISVDVHDGVRVERADNFILVQVEKMGLEGGRGIAWIPTVIKIFYSMFWSRYLGPIQELYYSSRFLIDAPLEKKKKSSRKRRKGGVDDARKSVCRARARKGVGGDLVNKGERKVGDVYGRLSANHAQPFVPHLR